MDAKRCAKCEKTVYPVEEVKCLDKLWHKACFKCEECGMTLNMKNYKGFDKKPYCGAHVPKAKATIVADTPEMKRLAANSKIQSNVQYHAEFEASKSKFTVVADDPESKRLAANTRTISNITYHGLVEQKEEQEKKRSMNEGEGGGPVAHLERKQSEGVRREEPRAQPVKQIQQPLHQQLPSPPQQQLQQQQQQQQQHYPSAVPKQQQLQQQPSQPRQAQQQQRVPSYEASRQPQQYHQAHVPQQQAYAQQQRQPQSQYAPQQQQQHYYQQQQQQQQRSMSMQMQQQHQYQPQMGAQRSTSMSSAPPYGAVSYGAHQPRDVQQQQQQQAYLQQQHYQQQQRSHQPQQQPSQVPPQHKTSLPKSAGDCYQAIYDYDAQDEDEVSFRDGDLITNCVKIDDGWMCGTVHRTGQYGMLPANYVTTIRL